MPDSLFRDKGLVRRRSQACDFEFDSTAPVVPFVSASVSSVSMVEGKRFSDSRSVVVVGKNQSQAIQEFTITPVNHHQQQPVQASEMTVGHCLTPEMLSNVLNGFKFDHGVVKSLAYLWCLFTVAYWLSATVTCGQLGREDVMSFDKFVRIMPTTTADFAGQYKVYVETAKAAQKESTACYKSAAAGVDQMISFVMVLLVLWGLGYVVGILVSCAVLCLNSNKDDVNKHWVSGLSVNGRTLLALCFFALAAFVVLCIVCGLMFWGAWVGSAKVIAAGSVQLKDVMDGTVKFLVNDIGGGVGAVFRGLYGLTDWGLADAIRARWQST